MSTPNERLSLREFARRVTCDPRQVRRWIDAGKLARDADGTLDSAAVPAWRTLFTAGKSETAEAPALDVRTPRGHHEDSEGTLANTGPAKTAQALPQGGDDMTYQEARRRREVLDVQTKQLDYDLRSGAVVKIADIAAILGAQCNRIRTRLLAIPSSLAARVALLSDPRDVNDLLNTAICDALLELTADAPNR